MRKPHLRAIVAALAAVVAMAACESSEPADGSATGAAATTGAALPGSPSRSPVPNPTASALPPPVPPAPSPTFATTLRGYTEAVISAWQQDRFDVLANLATPAVLDQIRKVPLTVNADWTFMQCANTGGSSDCRFINAVGDLLTLRISRSLLGKARAVTDLRLDTPT